MRSWRACVARIRLCVSPERAASAPQPRPLLWRGHPSPTAPARGVPADTGVARRLHSARPSHETKRGSRHETHVPISLHQLGGFRLRDAAPRRRAVPRLQDAAGEPGPAPRQRKEGLRGRGLGQRHPARRSGEGDGQGAQDGAGEGRDRPRHARAVTGERDHRRDAEGQGQAAHRAGQGSERQRREQRLPAAQGLSHQSHRRCSPRRWARRRPARPR